MSQTVERIPAAMPPPPETPGPRRRPRSFPELLARRGAGSLLLMSLALLVYVRHIATGGLYSDDWALNAVANDPSTGRLGALDFMVTDLSVSRPVSGLYYLVTHWLWGTNGHLHAITSVAMTLGVALLLYALLQELRIPRPDSFFIAALVVATPIGSAAVLWPAASPVRLAALLYVAGALIALRGTGVGGRRALLRHAVAAVFYLAAVLTYELALGLVAATVLLYAIRMPWRSVAWRWGVDLLVVAADAIWVRSHTPKDVQTLAAQLQHAREIAVQGLDQVSRALAPVGNRWPLVIAAIVLLAAATLMARGRYSGRPLRQLGAWAIVAGISAMFLTAAWMILVPAPSYYGPAGANMGNRINGIAAIPLVIFAYACWRMLVTMVVSGERRFVERAMLVVTLLLGAAYSHATLHDQGLYAESWRQQQRILGRVQELVPDIGGNETLFTVRSQAFVAPDLPVFAAEWDLESAVRVLYDQPGAEAFNAYHGFGCNAEESLPTHSESAPLDRSIIVDVEGSRVFRPKSAADCAQLLAHLSGAP